VSEVTEVLAEEFATFQQHDLTCYDLECLYLDAIYEALRLRASTKQPSARTSTHASTRGPNSDSTWDSAFQ